MTFPSLAGLDLTSCTWTQRRPLPIKGAGTQDRGHRGCF